MVGASAKSYFSKYYKTRLLLGPKKYYLYEKELLIIIRTSGSIADEKLMALPKSSVLFLSVLEFFVFLLSTQENTCELGTRLRRNCWDQVAGPISDTGVLGIH